MRLVVAMRAYMRVACHQRLSITDWGQTAIKSKQHYVQTAERIVSILFLLLNLIKAQKVKNLSVFQ